MKTFKELYEACCAACEKRTDIEEVKEPTGDLKKACWKGYTAIGMKMKNGRKVPNCVPANEEVGIDESEEQVLKRNIYVHRDASGKRTGIAATSKRSAQAQVSHSLRKNKIEKGGKIETQTPDKDVTIYGKYGTPTRAVLKAGMELELGDSEQIDEQAPVAPTLDRKYLKGTPEHKAYKASKVRQKFRLVYKDGKVSVKEETDRNQRLRDALAKIKNDFTKPPADHKDAEPSKPASAPKPKTGGGMPYYPDSRGGRRYMGDSVEMNGEQIDELSRDTLRAYAKKAVPDMNDSNEKSQQHHAKSQRALDSGNEKLATKHHNLAKKFKDRTEKRMAGVFGAIRRAKANEEVEQLEEAKHRVNVTVSDPNHSAVSKRTETTQKFVRLSAADEKSAVEKAKAHYKGKGYKVHSAEHAGMVSEAVYQGKKVPLNKPMAGDVKKSKVYVDPDGDGTAQKVNFGDKNMTIKKNIPARRKSFRARHNCENPGPKTKARFWSCKAW